MAKKNIYVKRKDVTKAVRTFGLVIILLVLTITMTYASVRLGEFNKSFLNEYCYSEKTKQSLYTFEQIPYYDCPSTLIPYRIILYFTIGISWLITVALLISALYKFVQLMSVITERIMVPKYEN